MSFIRNITLKQLRVLRAVAETGSVSAAAKVLNVTPPAVSLQLKLIEELSGVTLLRRGSGRMRPTAPGRLFLDAAAQIESIIADTGQMINAIKGTGQRMVRISVVSTAKYFIPRAIAAFRKQNPDIEINLWVGNRTETVAALESYECDFAIMGRPPGFNVEQALIGPHPHIIIAPPGHRLAKRKRKSRPGDLSGETFLMRERGSGTRVLTEELIDRIGDGSVRGMEIGSNETIKQAVMAGLGIALISAHTVSVELAAKRLSYIDVQGLPVMRTWQVIRRREKDLMPAGQVLWDFMISNGRQFLPGVV
ncbi:MAG TPA: LysR family transcriptional regulator [Rhizobiales bacterium]|nr:LysR family transcriptional regulator [Hyphomicrobiales bacterium]